jgi:hypothetical protein
MAFISSFEERPLSPRGVHDPVLCGYSALMLDGKRILQLETYGSRDRDVVDQPSQKIQLDVDGARSLKRIIESSFPGL